MVTIVPNRVRLVVVVTVCMVAVTVSSIMGITVVLNYTPTTSDGGQLQR
jgi:hypothetical protein